MTIETPTNILTLFKYARENGVELSIKYSHRSDAYKICMQDLWTDDPLRYCTHFISDDEFNLAGGEMVSRTLDKMLNMLRHKNG